MKFTILRDAGLIRFECRLFAEISKLLDYSKYYYTIFSRLLWLCFF